MSQAWIDDVLGFWFGELTPKDWFTGSDEADERIRSRFLPVYEQLRKELPQAALSEPRAALAAILVFDQFPRNMFRSKPEAFATDQMALQLSANAVEKGLDADMTPQERQFLYMPYMHSEVLADQERAVMLFSELGNEEARKFAVEHSEIVARFGRFPHRNKALGRESTQEELDFLKEHAGYGQ